MATRDGRGRGLLYEGTQEYDDYMKSLEQDKMMRDNPAKYWKQLNAMNPNSSKVSNAITGGRGKTYGSSRYDRRIPGVQYYDPRTSGMGDPNAPLDPYEANANEMRVRMEEESRAVNEMGNASIESLKGGLGNVRGEISGMRNRLYEQGAILKDQINPLYGRAMQEQTPYTRAGQAGLEGLQDPKNLEGLYEDARQRVMRSASARGQIGSTKVPEYLAGEYAQIAGQEADRRTAINAQLAGMGGAAAGRMANLYGQQVGALSGIYQTQTGQDVGMTTAQAGMEYGVGGDLSSIYQNQLDRMYGMDAANRQADAAKRAGMMSMVGSLGGAAIGGALGGPPGAAAGYGAGGALGGAAAGMRYKSPYGGYA